MDTYLYSNSEKVIEHWQSVFQDSKVIAEDALTQVKGVLIVEYSLFDRVALRDDLKLIVLDKEPEFTKCIALMQKGVKAYGNIHMHKSHLLSALESVKDGKVWIYPDFTSMLLSMTQASQNTISIDVKIQELSVREKEIAQLIYDGLTNKEIAIELGITTNTIKNHTKNIYAKLGVNDRLSLFAYLKN